MFCTLCRTWGLRPHSRCQHALALVDIASNVAFIVITMCLAEAVFCRLRPVRKYNGDNLPARFPHSSYSSYLFCTNNPIMEAELCPLDDRRSATELSLKLGVVHFTTMTAYCHLLSMRGEPVKVICRKMIIFFIFPGSIIIQHAMAILAILSAFPLVRLKKLQDSALLQSSLGRAPFILFGAINQQPSQPKENISNGESIAKIIGRILVVLALSAQCIGSCIIFARRYQHDATTISDWRVLELAIAALFICLLTMVHLFWHPELRLDLNDILEQFRNNRLTYLDTMLLHFWGVPTLVDSGSSKDERRKWLRRAVGAYFNTPTTLAAYWLQPWESRKTDKALVKLFSSGGLVGTLDVLGYESTICDQCTSTGRLGFEIGASLNQIFFFAMSIMASLAAFRIISVNVVPARWKAARWWTILLQVLILMPLGLFTWGLVIVLGILVCISLLSPLLIAFMFVSCLSYLVLELLVLANWPTDLACPLLWSDPNANFLWHLM